jgi:hypothetical protein
VQYFKKFSTRLFLFYNKFQTLILTLFVIGFIDLFAYTDIIITLLALPEFIPIVVVILIAIGLYKYLIKRKNKGI